MTGKTALIRLTVIGWCAISINAVFTQDEVETVLSTLRFLRIGECILTLGVEDWTVLRVLGGSLISTGIMGVELLKKNLGKTKPPDALTAIIIKVNESSEIKKLLTENSERLHWFVWFLISDDGGDLDPEIRIPFNCQYLLIEKGPHREHRLVEVYHVKNSTTYRNLFGVWTPENGLNVPVLNMYRRRTDLRGIELEITICNKYTVEIAIQEFWKDYANILNYSLKMEAQKSNQTISGYEIKQKPDGTTCLWGITGLDVDQDWLFSTFGEKVKFGTKYRGTNEVGWRAYVQPFTKELWTAVGSWLFLSTFAIVIVNGCTRKTMHLNAFTAMFCLCNSDPMVVHPPGEPLRLSANLVYLMSLAVPAVIVPAYSAYVLSTLSIVLPLEPFVDVKSFIADGTYRLSAVRDTFAVRYMWGSKDPDLKYIYDHLFVGVENQVPTFSVLFENLCKDNKLAGLFVDNKSFRRLFRCRMFVMPRDVSIISTGMLLPKGSPLRKMLNQRLVEYHERGVKSKLMSEDNVQTYQEETEALNSLNMSQMQAIFWLVPLGVFLSLSVLLLEVFVDRRQRRNKILPTIPTRA